MYLCTTTGIFLHRIRLEIFFYCAAALTKVCSFLVEGRWWQTLQDSHRVLSFYGPSLCSIAPCPLPQYLPRDRFLALVDLLEEKRYHAKQFPLIQDAVRPVFCSVVPLLLQPCIHVTPALPHPLGGCVGVWVSRVGGWVGTSGPSWGLRHESDFGPAFVLAVVWVVGWVGG